MPFQPSTRSPQERQALRRARQQRMLSRRATLHDEWALQGLKSDGTKHRTYSGWKIARTRYAQVGKRAVVDALDRHYPAYFSRLDEETSLAHRVARRERAHHAARERMRLHNARKRAYRQEDIASGDVEIRNYLQFVFEMDDARRGGKHPDSAVTAALRTRYPAWYEKYRENRKKHGRRYT